METNYLNELNESQREAVLYNDGPSLVIAGAGSGKTRVLTYKIAYLLVSGIRPWNILALTFTNKAAREMKERIDRMVDERLSGGLWMGTFHSVFSKILRMEADSIGFSSSFTIYDSKDTKNLITSIIKEMDLDDKIYRPTSVVAHISSAKNRLITPEMYVVDASVQRADKAARIPKMGEIYQRYTARCRLSNAMDFDDLLLHTYLLFKHHPDICRKYADRFEFVLVDEYQDTNYAQHSIVWLLTQERQRVCVVGDDAQSIYSFRGANIDNILNFTQQYTDARVYKLEQNYRSTQTIVEAANSLINHNGRQIRKNVFSEKEKGSPIEVMEAYSDIEEAEMVIGKMSRLHSREHLAYDDIAILYRTNAQSRTFEESLLRHTIPYRIYGGQSFYQRKEIKDVIAYCRLAVNPDDEEAFKRVINYPKRGIGQTTVDKLMEAASAHEVSLWTIIGSPEEYGLAVSKAAVTKLQSFRMLMQGFVDDAKRTDAASLMERVICESGIMGEIHQDSSPEGLSRQENVQELFNGVKEFVESRREMGQENNLLLSDFLQEVSLMSDLDEDKSDDAHKVTLMTVHSAKGLEFRAVFVVGMEENLFPSSMAGESVRAMEEERRLFYVAMTRAEQYCCLTYARSRYRYGKTEFSNPSRFLMDIDRCYLDVKSSSSSLNRGAGRAWQTRDEDGSGMFSRRPQSAYDMERSGSPATLVARVSGLRIPGRTATSVRTSESVASRSSSAAQASSASTSSSALRVGQTIEHERFGIGTVTNVEGSGENTKATVKFRNTGEKQLLLRFARFKIIG